MQNLRHEGCKNNVIFIKKSYDMLIQTLLLVLITRLYNYFICPKLHISFKTYIFLKANK
jgi:hypothetical protein